jgi:hypothetical protein
MGRITNEMTLGGVQTLGFTGITIRCQSHPHPEGENYQHTQSSQSECHHPGKAGDGLTDDTDALQRALNETVGRHKVLYFPKGTYLVSRTLTWPKRWNDRDNWGFTILRGLHRELATLRLRDGTFTNAAQPQAIMRCGGFGSADWFHNYVEHLTFDVGQGNPGAIGLQFYSNNSGAIRDCRFVSGDGSGSVGLDLAHRDMNGPLLVRNCEVIGFRRGVATAHSVNSQTFEHLTLRGQTRTDVRE